MRGHVVTFRPAARIAMQTRCLRSGRVPGVVLRLDERRRRPARRRWFFTGSGRTLLLFFLKVFRPWNTSPTRTGDVTRGSGVSRDTRTAAFRSGPTTLGRTRGMTGSGPSENAPSGLCRRGGPFRG
jgi:hypothetical protein